VSVALTLSDPDSGESYVRGGAGFEVSGRTVLRATAVTVLAALLATTVALFIGAARQNSVRSALKHRGVAVTATVTACLGVVGGTGIVVNRFDCRAAFEVGGRHYVDRLQGTSMQLQQGQAVAAVVDPRSLSVLYTAASVASARKSSHAYFPAIVSLVVTIALAATLGLWWRKGAAEAA
jgi:hypothetical protein